MTPREYMRACGVGAVCVLLAAPLLFEIGGCCCAILTPRIEVPTRPGEPQIYRDADTDVCDDAIAWIARKP